MNNPLQKSITRMESKNEEKFSELNEEIADLKKSVGCLQVKMDAADNDLGFMSADINDLFRSVHRNHESIMDEIVI